MDRVNQPYPIGKNSHRILLKILITLRNLEGMVRIAFIWHFQAWIPSHHALTQIPRALYRPHQKLSHIPDLNASFSDMQAASFTLSKSCTICF